MIFIYILFALWFIRNKKYILFWIYLWQLKDYHVGRFVDHFRTEKGKRLILHPLYLVKIIIAGGFFLYGYVSLLFWLLFAIYLLEAGLYVQAVLQKKAKNPVITKKTIFLIATNILLMIAFSVDAFSAIGPKSLFLTYLVAFDILIPVLVSIIVLLFQPIAVVLRSRILQRAEIKMRDFKGLTVIGVTGSYGKTSTKEFLTTILSQKFKVLSTKDHQNAEVGVARSVLEDLNKDHQIFVAEMGAYKKGGIELISRMINPKIGVVTGVNEQHLALFGSMENLLSAEGGEELLNCLPDDGKLFVNGENKYCLDLYNKANIKKVLYTLDQVKDVNIQKDSSSFSIEGVNFRVNILGRHHLLNLIGAISVARSLGMNLTEIAKATEKISKDLSYKVSKNKKGVNIIDSTYSANPDGVIADLEYLKLYPGKKVIIMPCLIELGPKAEEVHKNLGQAISKVCDLTIITTNEYFEELKDNNFKEESILQTSDVNLILEKIKSFCNSQDTVLLEGRLPESLISATKKDTEVS